MTLNKQRLSILEQAAHEILNPLGFKRQKATWRRRLPEVLQQFSIVSMQLGARYRPEWGINLFAFSEDPRPQPNRLHVRWILEQFLRPKRGMTVRREVLDVLGALDLASDMDDARRAKHLSRFLNRRVLPCFETYQTKDSVRGMMADYGSPFRAQTFSGCPESWWPHE